MIIYRDQAPCSAQQCWLRKCLNSIPDVRVHFAFVVTLPIAPAFYINDLLSRKMPRHWFVDIHTIASEFKHSNGGNFILHLSFSNFAQGCQDLIVFQPFFNIYSLLTVTPCTHLHYQHPFYDASSLLSERRDRTLMWASAIMACTVPTRADAIKKVIRGHNVHKYFRENCHVPS